MVREERISPVTSACSFSVVIDTKKDLVLRFCIDYRTVYQRMKAKQFPSPKILKIFYELAGGVLFTTFDFSQVTGKSE